MQHSGERNKKYSYKETYYVQRSEDSTQKRCQFSLHRDVNFNVIPTKILILARWFFVCLFLHRQTKKGNEEE